jgi:hypothetical protein
MNLRSELKVGLLAGGMLAGALGSGGPANAGDPPAIGFVLPAGLARNFELPVAAPGGNTLCRELPDGNGNAVRTLGAGRKVIVPNRTDAPAGPSTTLHLRRVAFPVSGNRDFALQQLTGRTTDICTASCG